MADLMPEDGDRGQLLLVAGFAIAVTIVALVLLLNTAIYTENLATRDVDTRSSDALAFRDIVEDGLWAVVEGAALNDDDETDRGDVEANVTRRVERFENYSSRHTLGGGAGSAVDVVTLHEGARVRQTDPDRNLTDGSRTANWTVATDVDGAQQFDLNTTGGLVSTDDPANDSFRVEVVGSGGDRWSLYVYNDTTGDPTIAVENGSGPITTDVCGGLVTGPPRVGLRAGTVNGVGCDAIDFAAGTTPPYDVSVTYGNRSRGTYDAVVNTTAVDATVDDTAPLDSPYWVPVVYGLDADVTYQSETLTYRSRVGIEPVPVSAGGGVLQFVKAPGETVGNDDNPRTLEFDIENTGGEDVTVEKFAVDATDIDADVTIDNSNAAELEIRTVDTADEGQADRDGSGVFDADRTIYDLVDDSDGDGQYATIRADNTVEIDIREFSRELGPFEVTYDESEADLSVTFVLSDGSAEVFYFREQ
ncbi:DUF7261 family protein [Haloplanus salilacus]|uniref:DUF7261 family protein n=1 Tax=Haloplanus salilacus TaxID=2949994 RepID=UPI0030CF04B2